MKSKKIKYKQLLDEFPNCPPEEFSEIEAESFRWVHSELIPRDFLPLNIINEPPARILDNSDLVCKGYGLSFFNSYNNAKEKYKRLYTNKRVKFRDSFMEDYGDSIAKIQLLKKLGISGDLNKETGHFTFHEYEETNLINRITEILNIFDDDGKISDS